MTLKSLVLLTSEWNSLFKFLCGYIVDNKEKTDDTGNCSNVKKPFSSTWLFGVLELQGRTEVSARKDGNERDAK